MVLNAFVDDSASVEDGRELVLAGYFASAEEWERFSDLWDLTLRKPPSIAYFHASEAESRKDEFAGWSEDDRDAKVLALARVIDAHQLHSFDCRMSQEAFERILLPVSPYDLRSPYFMLFDSVLTAVAQQVEFMGIDLPVDFVFDNQGRVGIEALLWYGPFKAMQPPNRRKLLGAPPIFRSDKEVLPLQAADCLAWHVRRSREERNKDEKREALPILRKDLHHERWVTEEILHNIADQFKGIVPEQDRLKRSASVIQPLKHVVGAITRMPVEQHDSEFEKFNNAMEKLLKVPPQIVRDAMEQEKRERAEARKEKESKDEA